MSKTPLDVLKERIEQGAAGSPVADDRGSRDQLYDRILDALEHAQRKKRGDGTKPEEILLGVLNAVLHAREKKGKPDHESATELRRARYWRERERLDLQIEALAFHPLISSFPRDEIEIKSIDALYCEHDRHRESCIWIREQLERLRADPADARAREFLDALSIDPKTARPESFCVRPASRTIEEILAQSKTSPRPKRKSRGRPLVDPAVDEFLSTAAELLVRSGGLSRERSYGFAAELVGACLGPEVDAESKMRQARRRRQRTESPNTRDRASPRARRTK